MVDAQLLKGILEGCVLGVIARGETYGYEILSKLEQNGFEELGEGTLYPVLTRLDKNGYVSCRKASRLFFDGSVLLFGNILGYYWQRRWL